MMLEATGLGGHGEISGILLDLWEDNFCKIGGGGENVTISWELHFMWEYLLRQIIFCVIMDTTTKSMIRGCPKFLVIHPQYMVVFMVT